MKPFIGFDTGAGRCLRVVHWDDVADEAVAGRVAPASPAAAARAMAMRANFLIARSFQSVLRLGTLSGVGASHGSTRRAIASAYDPRLPRLTSESLCCHYAQDCEKLCQ